MTGRLLVCRDCGQPLVIVCPTHGETVSKIVEDRPVLTPNARRREMVSVPRQVLAALSTDREHPSRVPDIARALTRTSLAVSVALSGLKKQGLVEHLGRSRWIAKVCP